MGTCLASMSTAMYGYMYYNYSCSQGAERRLPMKFKEFQKLSKEEQKKYFEQYKKRVANYSQ